MKRSTCKQHCNCSFAFLRKLAQNFAVPGSVIFQVLHFPALQFGPSFSRSCIFQSLIFFGPPFSGPANSAPPRQKLELLAYISAMIVWVSIFIQVFMVASRKTHLFNRVRIGLSRSSKVHFGTNRKGVCDFLLVINGNFGPT